MRLVRVDRSDFAVAADNVEARVLDASTNELLAVHRAHNLVTAVGRNQIRDAIFGLSIVAPNRFAVGTSNAAVASSNITLGAEVWRDVFTTKTSSAQQIEIKYFLTSTTANGNTLREAGLFNASSGGDMYARVVFNDPIVKTSSVAVLFVWTLSWSAV